MVIIFACFSEPGGDDLQKTHQQMGVSMIGGPNVDPKHTMTPSAVSLKQGPFRAYLEGQEDLVNGLIMGITWVPIWVIGVINLLTKSP